MTWGPITKEKCWCQEWHLMGSACGCWSCPDCHRWYPCNPVDYSTIIPSGDFLGARIYQPSLDSVYKGLGINIPEYNI